MADGTNAGIHPWGVEAVTYYKAFPGRFWDLCKGVRSGDWERYYWPAFRDEVERLNRRRFGNEA